MRLCALLFILFSMSGCMHEWLGPMIERVGDSMQRQGVENTARLVGEIKTGREVSTKDLLTPLGLLLGGTVMAGGGVWIKRNGKKKNGA